MEETTQTTTPTCPHCSGKQTVDIPTDRCLAFHQCEHCGKVIEVPKESSNCCVVCEYGDQKCPSAASADSSCNCFNSISRPSTLRIISHTILWLMAIVVVLAGAFWLGSEVYYGYVVAQTTQLADFTVLGVLAFAALAGLMVNFGPCSLAILPAYVSYYLSADHAAARTPLWAGTRAGALAAAGVVIFYIVIGAMIAVVGTGLAQFARQIKLTIAGLIFLIGVLMLVWPEQETGFLKRFQRWVHRETKDAAPAGKLSGFGAIYAAGGLSCLFPVFLPLVMYPVLSGELVISFISFVVFALAQALFLIAVTIAVAYGRQAIVLKLSGVQQWLPRSAGALLIATSAVMVSTYLYFGM
jgi:cytochrome c-type biogenesis protein